jgi:predicted nucleic acid-binding Zn ribbon protein
MLRCFPHTGFRPYRRAKAYDLQVKSDKPSAPTAIREVLAGYLSTSGLGRRLAQAGVIPEWPRLVGPQISAVTTPESVAPDGTLFIRVRTSAWMNELQLLTPEILARVNAGRGAGRVRTIRWLLAR